ncbi:C-terminal processing protease CtpA/Prc [Pontibacter ummariensis]|uniref:C-terminal processing protease CtpA/Prc, contains a PDZ domain n=1 Tax=Pontibacter ummariensis TaxID=1610492 RepID=A0A239KFT8_9BACT|nr:S41 family peptidase [Pontibacter ummariensis]PRY06420.1 C-terminal processing protease CtpA/Prc [Pontibacter ummariensis]SNT16935.1 C-terminal processing protease CtpA/Prc, contains a PDZ domain [Pontibacter ummariensis]
MEVTSLVRKAVFAAGCLFTLTASAQTPVFDSTAYLAHYATRWQSRTLETPYQDNISEQEKIAGLSKLWMEAKLNYANFDLVPRLDFDSLYLAFIPKVQHTKSTLAYYEELQSFYHHLKDGHSLVLVPTQLTAQTKAVVPMLVHPIEGKPVIWKVLDKRLRDLGIREGMEITSVDGIPVAARMADRARKASYSTPQDSAARVMYYWLTAGNVAEKAKLEVVDKKGKAKSFDVPRADYYKGNLFPSPMFQTPLEYSVLPNNVGYLQLHTFNDPRVVAQFDSVFSQIAKTDALIIDVRTNGGGNGGYGHEILGYLTDKPFQTGKTHILQYQGVQRPWGNNPYSTEVSSYDWKPYKDKRYNKPVFLLTGPLTYSAAEDFTLAFLSTDRGLVIGEATGGSTGQPVFFMLPGGGFGAVCAKRDLFWDNRQFVGYGIQPDVQVPLKIKDVQNGKDTQLEKALALLKKGITTRDHLSKLP